MSNRSKRYRKQVPSQRQLRVGEELRHVLAQIIERTELTDPDLDGISITVSEVRISSDLRNATVFVIPLGGEDSDKVVKGLNRATPFLRHRIAGRMHLRRIPNLYFESDISFDNAQHIYKLLGRVRRKKNSKHGTYISEQFNDRE